MVDYTVVFSELVVVIFELISGMLAKLFIHKEIVMSEVEVLEE